MSEATDEIGRLRGANAWDRFKEEFVREYNCVSDDDVPYTKLGEIKRVLEKAGLKIVEK